MMGMDGDIIDPDPSQATAAIHLNARTRGVFDFLTSLEPTAD